MEKFLRSNHFARGLAVFLAIVMWLFVTGDNITRSTPSRKVYHDVPLTIENMEPGLVVVEMPATVDVTLEGLPDTFDGLTLSELEAYVDLTEKGPGTHRLWVRGRPPRGMTLIGFSRPEVEVVVETLSSAFFPVHAEFIGSPAEGWMRLNFSLLPSQVRVEGPTSIINSISRVVLRVDQRGVSEDFEEELIPIALDLQGNEMPGVALFPNSVIVTMELRKTSDE